MTYNLEKERPEDPIIELALLTWWKICMVEMMGNSHWKHKRDYKAVVTLFKKYMNRLKDETDDWDQVNYEENIPYLKYTASELEDNWNYLEDIRIAVHNWLEYKGDEFNPKGIELAPHWAIERIRDLTNS